MNPGQIVRRLQLLTDRRLADSQRGSYFPLAHPGRRHRPSARTPFHRVAAASIRDYASGGADAHEQRHTTQDALGSAKVLSQVGAALTR